MSDAPVAVPPPRATVVMRWRWRVYAHPASWALALGAVLVFVLLVAAAVAANFLGAELLGLAFDGRRDWAFVATSVAVHGTLSIGALLAMVAIHARATGMAARSFVATVPATEPARGYMMAELAESGPPKEGWSPWQAGRWVAMVRAHGSERAFVGHSLSERTRTYECTDQQVEPERLGARGGAGGIARVALLLVLAALAAARQGPVSVLPIALAAAAAAVTVRLVRRRALLVPVVAGQGWVQHGRARWTVADSVLVATGWPQATIRIVGPPGVLVLSLGTKRHQELETLWVRWMHPNPLLGQRPFED